MGKRFKRLFFSSAAFVTFLSLILYPALSAPRDGQESDWNQRLNDLENRLKAGNREALFEIGEFLDDQRTIVRETEYGTLTKTVREITLDDLESFTHFSRLKINENLDKKAFLDFLKTYKEEIFYSDLIGKFLDVPLEKRKIEYVVRRRPKPETDAAALYQKYQTLIKDYLKTGDWSGVCDEIQKMSRLTSPECRQFLITFIKEKRWLDEDDSFEDEIKFALALGLRFYEDIETAQAVAQLFADDDSPNEEDYSPLARACLHALSRITNVNLAVLKNDKKITGKDYLKLIRDLKTLEVLKIFGYESHYPFRIGNFKSAFDYYKKLLLAEDDNWWIKLHAINDMKAMKNPLLLEYVGSLVPRRISFELFASRLISDWLDVTEILEGLTGVTIEIKDEQGRWTTQIENDETARINYLSYWVSHCRDYRWDKSQQSFANLKDPILEANRCDSLFKKLISGEETEVQEAFRQLSDEDPEEVQVKIDQYKLQWQTNFKASFLKQLVRFTDYCRKKSITYKPSPSLLKKIKELEGELSERERYRMENDLSLQAAIEDIAPFEYWILLAGEDNWRLSHSLSRVLDVLYSDHWKDILQSPQQLKFYLKKSRIFDDLGIVGLCHNYLNKFANSSDETLSRIQDMIQAETDNEVKMQGLKVLAVKGSREQIDKKEEAEKTIPLGEFLSRAETMDRELISSVQVEDQENDYKLIVDAIQGESRKEVLRKLVDLLAGHVSLTMVPQLFRLIHRTDVLDEGYMNFHDELMRDHTTRFSITLSDRLVEMLEYLYSHQFPPPSEPESDITFISGSYSGNAYLRNKGKTSNQWLKLWQADPEGYRKWGEKFYAQKMAALSKSQFLSVEDINDLLGSRYCRPEDKEIILQALSKVTPRELTYLKIDKGRLTDADLKYFENLPLPAKKVSEIISRFEIPLEKSERFMPFVQKISRNYPLSEKGEMFLDFSYYEWFRIGLREMKDENYKREVLLALKEFQKQLSPDDTFYLPRIEEMISFVQRCDLPLEEQLKMILAETETSKEGQETKVVEILKSAFYEDLGVILKYYPQLPISDYKKVRYLLEDLGICIPDLSDEKPDWNLIKELEANYRSMTEYGFYRLYLDRFGLDYKKTDGSLDFNKILRILKFDTKFGLVVDSHPYNHVYSLVRVLELTFNDRLNHEKHFNYTVDSLILYHPGRVNDWLNYLQDKGLIRIKPDDAPSFSSIGLSRRDK